MVLIMTDGAKDCAGRVMRPGRWAEPSGGGVARSDGIRPA